MILLGPSGFSYDDWVGTVYPADLPRRDWLPFIARQFGTIELNVTYYRLPGARTVKGWVSRTPERFQFSVKAHQSLTHEREAPDFSGFVESLGPLVESGKLACVLAQFPFSFHPHRENREYLARLAEGMGVLPVVVEFRDSAWVTDETFEDLRRLGLGFCCVDEPQLKGLMPPIVRATGAVGYVRFHGRNAERWWEHENAWERYDYTYKQEELAEWLPRLRDLEANTEVTMVYANNHYRGQSISALQTLMSLLARA